jgi:hypothetical protein
MKKARPLKGWNMSAAQASAFWRLWAGVMRCQRWAAAESETRRHAVLSALGFASIKDVGMTNDYDDLKKLLLLLCDKVLNEQEDLGFFVHKVKGGGVASQRDTEGQRRRYLHRIGEQVSELEQRGYGAALKKIIVERFGVVEGVSVLGDLETRELLNVVQTLDRCLSQQTEKAEIGHADSGGDRWEEEVMEMAAVPAGAAAIAEEGNPF